MPWYSVYMWLACQGFDVVNGRFAVLGNDVRRWPEGQYGRQQRIEECSGCLAHEYHE